MMSYDAVTRLVNSLIVHIAPYSVDNVSFYINDLHSNSSTVTLHSNSVTMMSSHILH